MSDTPGLKASTRLIHAGEVSERLSRTVGPAVQRGSTVLLPSAAALYDESRPTYGRGGLETHQALMSALAELENATTVRLFPSGLAALTGAMLAVLSAGDDILVSDGAYKPTRRFCDHALRRFGVQTRYYDPAIAPEDLLAMALPATRLIVMESPSSLTFEVQDVPVIAALAKARGILTLVDNTWAAGVLFKPLDHGVDISAQALTKYVGGHSDVFMGSAASRDPVVGRALEQSIWDFGWAVSPDDAYQMLRGLRTLPVRLERHGASALAIARRLSKSDVASEEDRAAFAQIAALQYPPKAFLGSASHGELPPEALEKFERAPRFSPMGERDFTVAATSIPFPIGGRIGKETCSQQLGFWVVQWVLPRELRFARTVLEPRLTWLLEAHQSWLRRMKGVFRTGPGPSWLVQSHGRGLQVEDSAFRRDSRIEIVLSAAPRQGVPRRMARPAARRGELTVAILSESLERGFCVSVARPEPPADAQALAVRREHLVFTPGRGKTHQPAGNGLDIAEFLVHAEQPQRASRPWGPTDVQVQHQRELALRPAKRLIHVARIGRTRGIPGIVQLQLEQAEE